MCPKPYQSLIPNSIILDKHIISHWQVQVWDMRILPSRVNSRGCMFVEQIGATTVTTSTKVQAYRICLNCRLGRKFRHPPVCNTDFLLLLSNPRLRSTSRQPFRLRFTSSRTECAQNSLRIWHRREAPLNVTSAELFCASLYVASNRPLNPTRLYLPIIPKSQFHQFLTLWASTPRQPKSVNQKYWWTLQSTYVIIIIN